jgi:hypothetical protein
MNKYAQSLINVNKTLPGGQPLNLYSNYTNYSDKTRAIPINQPFQRLSSGMIQSSTTNPPLSDRDSLGNNRLPFSGFPNTFNDPMGSNHPELNIPLPTQHNLTPFPHYLSIDSRDRDRRIYPNSNEYKIYLKGADDKPSAILDNDYRNVISVELVSAIYPNTNNILNEMYLLLQVNEIEGFYDSSNTPTNNAFAKIYPDAVVGPFVRAKTSGVEFLGIKFRPANLLASLNSMTIKWRKYDGTLFNFGVDNPPNMPTNPEVNHTITFKITTLEPDTTVLGHHNV